MSYGYAQQPQQHQQQRQQQHLQQQQSDYENLCSFINQSVKQLYEKVQSSWKQEKEDYEKQLRERFSKEQQLNDTIQTLNRQSNDNLNKCKQHEQQFRDQQNKIQQLEQQLRDQQNKCKQLEQQYRDQQNKIHQLLEQQDLLRRENDDISAVLRTSRWNSRTSEVAVVYDDPYTQNFSHIIEDLNEKASKVAGDKLIFRYFNKSNVPKSSKLVLYFFPSPSGRFTQEINVENYEEAKMLFSNILRVVSFRWGTNSSVFTAEESDLVQYQFLHYQSGLTPCRENDKVVAKLFSDLGVR